MLSLQQVRANFKGTYCASWIPTSLWHSLAELAKPGNVKMMHCQVLPMICCM